MSWRQPFVTSCPATMPRRAALRASSIVIPSSIGPTPLKEITALPSSGLGFSAAVRAEAAAGNEGERGGEGEEALHGATLVEQRRHRQRRDALAAADEAHPLARSSP